MRPGLAIAYGELLDASLPSIDYCKRHSIDFGATVPACRGVFLVEAEQQGRLFAPRRGETLMAWVDALDVDAETLVDAVAWPLDQPDCILTLGGVATALGEACAWNPSTYAFGEPLRLHRTPLAWLQARCDGSVLLDPIAGARWLIDLDAPRIATADRAHARELVAAMDRLVGRDRFIVPTRNTEAAA